MALTRTCVIDIKTGEVVNVLELGGEVPANCAPAVAPPDGFLWIEHERAGRGWRFVGGAFIEPPTPPQPNPLPQAPDRTEQLIAVLKAKNVITDQDIPKFAEASAPAGPAQ